MRRCTMILSDVHLSTLARSSNAMAHRRPDRQPDALLAGTIDQALAQARRAGARLELVLNGDLFDLDAAPVDASEPGLEERRCELGAADMMRRILTDHPVFMSTLYRVVSAGHRVVAIPGNHDAQLAFPAVRRELVRSLGTGLGVAFRAWFHVTEDGVLVEHGHLYDPLCRMERLYPVAGRLEDTVGTVSTHYGSAIFDGISPYAADPFAAIGGDTGVLLDCLSGKGNTALACLRELMLVGGSAGGDAQRAEWHASVARETRATPQALALHESLAAAKADATLLARASCREYDYGRDVDARLRSAMLALARLYQARVVVMGHTHEAFRQYVPAVPGCARPVTFANSGTWAPLGTGAGAPAGTFVWVTSDDRGAVGVRLYRVMADGRIIDCT